MRYDANTPEEYIQKLPEPRRSAVAALRAAVRKNLPGGFEEMMRYGMIGYAVPLSIHPAGYLGNPREPLPFLGIASQKRHISLYHMGLYAFPELLGWFRGEYEKAGVGRLDMGKSCMRFAREDRIPLDLIAELCRKISVEDYIRQAAR